MICKQSCQAIYILIMKGSILIFLARYAAKILRIRMQKKEVLVHFAGWQSKWDVWLPHNSERIRFPKEVKEKVFLWWLPFFHLS